jgi:hypothetical protein
MNHRSSDPFTLRGVIACEQHVQLMLRIDEADLRNIQPDAAKAFGTDGDEQTGLSEAVLLGIAEPFADQLVARGS